MATLPDACACTARPIASRIRQGSRTATCLALPCRRGFPVKKLQLQDAIREHIHFRCHHFVVPVLCQLCTTHAQSPTSRLTSVEFNNMASMHPTTILVSLILQAGSADSGLRNNVSGKSQVGFQEACIRHRLPK